VSTVPAATGPRVLADRWYLVVRGHSGADRLPAGQASGEDVAGRDEWCLEHAVLGEELGERVGVAHQGSGMQVAPEDLLRGGRHDALLCSWSGFR
jgi:hypothetical protein